MTDTTSAPIAPMDAKGAKAAAKAATAHAKALRPWYKKKRFILSGIIVLVIVIIFAMNAGGKPTAVTTPTTAAPSITTPAHAASTTPAAPATRTCRSAGYGNSRHVWIRTFTGGKDVQAGLYNVTPGAGQSGNFSTQGNNQTYNEILGVADGQGVPSIRAQISNGDQITISGLSAVTFTPVPTARLVTAHATVNLSTGTWTVGQDIGAGRYVATPSVGQSGNFIVTGNDSYNEILGGSSADGGVPSVTVSLTTGDVIQVSRISQVTMTAE